MLGQGALAAAQASLHAGEFASALHVLQAVDASAPDALQRARADLMRAQIVSASGALEEVPTLLLAAAERLEPLDPVVAREAYLDAWGAALFAGDLLIPPYPLNLVVGNVAMRDARGNSLQVNGVNQRTLWRVRLGHRFQPHQVGGATGPLGAV